MREAAGAVLAGGKSSRMGTDKALLIFDNKSLLDRSVEKLKSTFTEVIVVTNGNREYNMPGVKEITDIYRNAGPMAGIHAALKNSSHYYVFITACDMPFWTEDTAEFLLNSCNGYDAAVPRVKGLFQPLLAVYSRNCIEAIENCINSDIHKVSAFYEMLKINIVEGSLLESICILEKTFYNINTPEDLKNSDF